MKSLAVVARAVLLVGVALGVLALAIPASASTAGKVGLSPAAAPTPKTAPRGGSGSPPNLSDTGPRPAVVDLTLLAGALLVVGVALDRAGRKPRPVRP